MSELDPLKNPDNGKVQIEMPAAPGTMGDLARNWSSTQIEAEVHRGESIRRAKGVVDPTDRRFGQGGSFIANMIAAGDRVYHKERKREGVIRELGADGRVRVKFENGEKHWVKAVNLVKL